MSDVCKAPTPQLLEREASVQSNVVWGGVVGRKKKFKASCQVVDFFFFFTRLTIAPSLPLRIPSSGTRVNSRQLRHITHFPITRSV